jgi:hypothetical protein
VGLGIYNLYINLSTMDEGVVAKKIPYKIEGHFIPI